MVVVPVAALEHKFGLQESSFLFMPGFPLPRRTLSAVKHQDQTAVEVKMTKKKKGDASSADYAPGSF